MCRSSQIFAPRRKNPDSQWFQDSLVSIKLNIRESLDIICIFVANNKCVYQTAQMRSLICTFVVRMLYEQDWSWDVVHIEIFAEIT